MIYVNAADVSKTNPSPTKEQITNETAEKSVKLVSQAVERKPASATATITTPTGSTKEEMKVIYPITGIIILSILATGIIVIKKRK